MLRSAAGTRKNNSSSPTGATSSIGTGIHSSSSSSSSSLKRQQNRNPNGVILALVASTMLVVAYWRSSIMSNSQWSGSTTTTNAGKDAASEILSLLESVQQQKQSASARTNDNRQEKLTKKEKESHASMVARKEEIKRQDDEEDDAERKQKVVEKQNDQNEEKEEEKKQGESLNGEQKERDTGKEGSAETTLQIDKKEEEEKVETTENGNEKGATSDQALGEVTPDKDAAQEQQQQAQSSSTTTGRTKELRQGDENCPFKDSPLYRSVYMYPTFGDDRWKLNEYDILSTAGKEGNVKEWPWLAIQRTSQNEGTSHYNIDSQHVQYSTELLVRELFVNPASCLTVENPDEATLFYVPYLPSVEHHEGHTGFPNYTPSPWGAAIRQVLDQQNYNAWEDVWGLSSKYWKQRSGADHILVFSEPMHGLYHPKSKRGNFHFIFSQYQLHAPIVISVELSTTFVNQYPACAAKNILVPYPNTDGRWFNGYHRNVTQHLLLAANITDITKSPAALPAEQQLSATANDGSILTTTTTAARPVAQFYGAGNHGTCRQLRQAMSLDYQCSPSRQFFISLGSTKYYNGMHMATFCPCPGGDSPSAKRMFDAILAGCIPVILSADYVWPFTGEFDKYGRMKDLLHPSDFSIRLTSADYEEPLLESKTCQPIDPKEPGLQAVLERVSAEEIARLRQGLQKARYLYGWYEFSERIPDNPLRLGVLPTGGTAHTVVQALADRAAGALWPACQKEMETDHGPNANAFRC